MNFFKLFLNNLFLDKHFNFTFKNVISIIHWFKVRISYMMNSWIYTTNHKRISINYFNFVLVAGTAGMSLATVIRLEFAYPGVGVLAGDSLQYLSIATAHGVIMVFYMIMPLVFGAFGNFLLPTQLGVHDVAFPRLNSAAFWFLPGGLIMLCQLVCVDRRYQRMNCFNIRELQGNLKRKFFSDLVNSNDHREILSETMIGLRFKTQNISNINPDMFSFYQYGTHYKPKSRNLVLNNLYNYSSNSSFFNGFDMSIISFFSSKTPSYFFNQLLFLANEIEMQLYRILSNLTFVTLFSSSSLKLSIKSLISSFFNFNLSPQYFTTSFFKDTLFNSLSTELVLFKSDNIKNTELETLYSGLENSSYPRSNKFMNSYVSYDYKCGNYLGTWDKLYPSLMTSFIEVARGVRKPNWIFSDQYRDLLISNYKTFVSKFSDQLVLKLADSENWYSSHVAPVDNFFNFFYIFSKKSLFKNRDSDSMKNIRWLSINSLDQKFYKMFSSISTQQRILSNWRQLKFTREAWRCKLLASRHQNTLYRRFIGEESYIWSIERNAKDLLPGWAMITPFSARTRFTAIGKTDIGLFGVFLAINASIVSSANFLVTYRYLSTLNNRKMRDARSFFSEGLITASWMMVAANPMLAIGILMLLSDRHWQTSFFDYSGGGDTVLFQHMFWFFGHPEVYIIMLPVFGFTNTIMSFYFRKRVSARASLMYSMYTIAFLGFFVWGHHMYMVGLSHTTRMLFSTLTVMISVPAATKLMHWCVTIVNSFFVMEVPLIFTLTFTLFFVYGGVSGMCVAHTGMDVLFHDTFYVIGHFHVMFAGSAMLGIFSAFYFYFPAIYGVKYSRIFAYLHYVYYVLGQTFTVVPMMWLGYCGMPRRVLDYPYALGGWHAIVSASHLLSVAAMLFFFIMIYDSIRQAKPAIRNTFGAGRFNTRLSFYFYEINRLSYIQRKSLYNLRLNKHHNKNLKRVDFLSIESSDTTLFSYRFYQK